MAMLIRYLLISGTGSVLTVDGTVEMDAVIMEGKSLRVGAVANVNNIAHPVSLARAVLEKVCLITKDIFD